MSKVSIDFPFFGVHDFEARKWNTFVKQFKKQSLGTEWKDVRTNLDRRYVADQSRDVIHQLLLNLRQVRGEKLSKEQAVQLHHLHLGHMKSKGKIAGYSVEETATLKVAVRFDKVDPAIGDLAKLQLLIG